MKATETIYWVLKVSSFLTEGLNPHLILYYQFWYVELRFMVEPMNKRSTRHRLNELVKHGVKWLDVLPLLFWLWKENFQFNQFHTFFKFYNGPFINVHSEILIMVYSSGQIVPFRGSLIHPDKRPETKNWSSDWWKGILLQSSSV